MLNSFYENEFFSQILTLFFNNFNNKKRKNTHILVLMETFSEIKVKVLEILEIDKDLYFPHFLKKKT